MTFEEWFNVSYHGHPDGPDGFAQMDAAPYGIAPTRGPGGPVAVPPPLGTHGPRAAQGALLNAGSINRPTAMAGMPTSLQAAPAPAGDIGFAQGPGPFGSPAATPTPAMSGMPTTLGSAPYASPAPQPQHPLPSFDQDTRGRREPAPPPAPVRPRAADFGLPERLHGLDNVPIESLEHVIAVEARSPGTRHIAERVDRYRTARQVAEAERPPEASPAGQPLAAEAEQIRAALSQDPAMAREAGRVSQGVAGSYETIEDMLGLPSPAAAMGVEEQPLTGQVAAGSPLPLDAVQEAALYSSPDVQAAIGVRSPLSQAGLGPAPQLELPPIEESYDPFTDPRYAPMMKEALRRAGGDENLARWLLSEGMVSVQVDETAKRHPADEENERRWYEQPDLWRFLADVGGGMSEAAQRPGTSTLGALGQGMVSAMDRQDARSAAEARQEREDEERQFARGLAAARLGIDRESLDIRRMTAEQDAAYQSARLNLERARTAIAGARASQDPIGRIVTTADGIFGVTDQGRMIHLGDAPAGPTFEPSQAMNFALNYSEVEEYPLDENGNPNTLAEPIRTRDQTLFGAASAMVGYDMRELAALAQASESAMVLPADQPANFRSRPPGWYRHQGRLVYWDGENADPY